VDDQALLAALRGDRSVEEVCRAAGITTAEFGAARDALLGRRLPPPEGRLEAAVGRPVEILRDRAGVPHVCADTTFDCYYGLGFAMAQDRLWQMDRLRRRALGRQAEVLGASYVRSDLTHRLVGIDRVAGAEVGRVDEQTRGVLDAFVAGINRQIEHCGRDLPIEFVLLNYEPEPFTVRDVLAILRGIWWSLNGRLETLVVAEAARFLPDEELRRAYLTPEAVEERIVPAGSPYPPANGGLSEVNSTLAGMGDNRGSNNWAVAGRRASTGKALLCSDPHQAFWLPSSWYEYALHGPAGNVAGAGHPGAPGLWWGANGSIAWGITNNASSTRDLYIEEVHPTDARRYRDGATWREFGEQEITIAVRGEEPRRHQVRSTVRGPIMNEVLPAVAEGGDPPLSLRWVGQEHLDDARALLAISRARDWAEFRSALRDWSVAVFNFGYADQSGFVGYQCAGRVPVRGRAARGFRQANAPDDVWQGYVPFEALPRLEDPPRGYIASANQRVVADDYPYPFVGAFAAGYRARRIGQELGSTTPLDRSRLIALQNDVKSCRAERLCPPLVRALAGNADPDVSVLRDTLAGWDYRYTLESAAPALFETFMGVWQERVAAERFPARLAPLVKGLSGPAAQLLEGDGLPWFHGDRATALQAAAVAAMALVRQRFGPEPDHWRWRAVHQAHWQHPLSTPTNAAAFDVGPAPVSGGNDTVRNTGAGSPPFAAGSGSEYRLVVDFAEPDHFWAVQNAGNSGQPGSRHYADQFAPWLAGEYHVIELQKTMVERDAEGLTTLVPSKDQT
jgi:penicillin G amidase